MAEKNRFYLYTEYVNLIEDLTDEETGKLFRAILRYENGEEIGDLSAGVKVAFSFIRHRLDNNAEEYRKKCEQNARNRTTDNERKRPSTDDNDRHTDNEDDNEKENEKDNENDTAKKKRAHGETGHVKLTEAEYERLKRDYGEELTEQAIAFLDSYMVEKAYKTKDHNRTLRRWVFDAVRKQNSRAPTHGGNGAQPINWGDIKV